MVLFKVRLILVNFELQNIIFPVIYIIKISIFNMCWKHPRQTLHSISENEKRNYTVSTDYPQ